MNQGYTWEAFLSRYNLAFLAGTAGAALVTLSPLPLIAAAFIEVVVLGTVPRTRQFRKLVDAERAAGLLPAPKSARGADSEVMARLSPQQQSGHIRLRDLRGRIEESYTRVGAGAQLAAQSLAKIDGLLRSHLRLMDQLNAHRQHMGASSRAEVERDIAALEADMSEDDGERIADIKRRRVEILQQRLGRYVRADENREVISHQIAAIEDLIRLVMEQALTMRAPEDVSEQLDTLAVELEQTEVTVREMDSFLRLNDALEAEVESHKASRR